MVLFLIQVTVGGWLEAWPNPTNGFQHQMGGHVALAVPVGPILAEAYLGMIWWGHDRAKAAGSFLNAEAGQVLERQHGGVLTVRLGPCAVGGWVGRRAFLVLGQAERWAVENSAEAQLALGPPWPTIGYVDGAGPAGRCDAGPVTVEARSGPLYRWHGVTLPWHDVWGRAHVHAGRVDFDASVEALGPRPGIAWDAAVMVELADDFWLGIRGGELAHPGFQRPLRRIAASFRARHWPQWWP